MTYLAGEAGIRQFLEIGAGIPTEENTHEIAQRIAPESRVVYADDDPVVLARAHTLRKSASKGATAYVNANPRDPDTILRQSRTSSTSTSRSRSSLSPCCTTSAKRTTFTASWPGS